MKSYTDIINELLEHIKRKDVDSVIATIKGTMEPLAQRQQLKQALLFLRTAREADTILHYSLRVGSKELRRVLTEHELIPKTFFTRKNANKYSPLSVAVTSSDYEYVEQALKSGSNPNELNGGVDISLLAIAAEAIDLKMVKLLIDYGANVFRHGACAILASFREMGDERNNHLSFIEDHKEIVNLLIQKGANVLAKFEYSGEKISLEAIPLLEFINSKYSCGETKDAKIVLENEVQQRKLLNYTIPLMFWASRNDRDSIVCNVPEDVFKKIASFARNGR